MLTPSMTQPYRLDVNALRPDRREDMTDWMAKCLVDEAIPLVDISNVIAITAGEHGYLLHLTRYRRNEQGRMCLDVAADHPVTVPLVVDLGTSPDWPAWLRSYAAGA